MPHTADTLSGDTSLVLPEFDDPPAEPLGLLGDWIEAAKQRGVSVTAGVTPAHFMLSDLATVEFRTFARLSPPLREEADRKAVIEAIGDGTIDVISSGHDPRGPEDKRPPFADAEPGMAGAETLLAMALSLVRDGVIDLPRVFDVVQATRRVERGQNVDAAERAQTGADADDAHAMTIEHGLSADVETELGQVRAVDDDAIGFVQPRA